MGFMALRNRILTEFLEAKEIVKSRTSHRFIKIERCRIESN